MTKSSKNQLEPWEVSLIKAMLQHKDFKKQQIVAYFSRPERSINQGRISEIESGHERYDDVPTATPGQLDKFLKEWRSIAFPTATTIQLPPTHAEVLERRFQVRKGAPVRLNVSETSEVEAKESFDWGNQAKYARTLVGMANNNGGYMLFGVKDGSFEVKGIQPDRMEKFDLAKAHQFISRSFNQGLNLEKGQFEVGGKTVGVLYVYKSNSKPVVCKATNKGLESGDVYFRYPGETRRIQEPELQEILRENQKITEQRFLEMMSKVGKAGVENSAVLNFSAGEVDGLSGSFLIDESLIDKLKFVSKGHFDEDVGAPALKLVGDVTPVGKPGAEIIKKVIRSVTERDIQKAFLDQKCEHDPETYICAQTMLQPKWFPVYFFANRAGLSLSQLKQVLEKAETDYPGRRDDQIKRIMKKERPAGPPNSKTVSKELEAIYSSDPIQVGSEIEAQAFLKALRIVDPDKVKFDRVLALLKDLWVRFGGQTTLRFLFRCAISSVDTMYFGPKVK